MIGGTERDAERAEELTRKVPEPLGIVFGSPGRGYAGFPKAYYADFARSRDYSLDCLNEIQCFFQLSINTSRQRFWRVFDRHIRQHATALDAFSLPRIPARDRHTEDVTASKLEIRASEDFACRSLADKCSETILFGETGYHFGCAVRMLIDENNDAPVKWLRTKALRNERH